MSCNGCGKSSCRGCKDVKVILPAGVGISSITDNENGTWTITYTDNSTEIINTPASPPSDSWVDLDETDMTSIIFAGTATENTTEIDLTYKIIAADTVIIKAKVRINATITALGNTLQNNFRFAPFGSSTWFTGTKLLTGMVQRVPISIYSNTTNILNPTGTVSFATVSSENLISIGETNLQISNGTYDFEIHFESICKIN